MQWKKGQNFQDKQLDIRSVRATPLQIPSSSLPRFVWRGHSDGLGKDGELFVEQLGLNKDVLHPALPLRHKRTTRAHGRTVSTRPLVLRCESQRIVSTHVLILKKLNVTSSTADLAENTQKCYELLPIIGLHLAPRLRMSGVIRLYVYFLVCTCTNVPLPLTSIYGSHG